MIDRPAAPQIGAQDVRALCGDLLDWKVSAILSLKPTPGDVAAAVGWAGGRDDLGQEGRPLEGVAAEVYDVLTSDEDTGPDRWAG